MSKKKSAVKSKATEPENTIDVQFGYAQVLRRLNAAEVEIEWLKDRLDKLEAAPKSWRWWT